MASAVIAANEDLLSEILLRLPVKPLFRFKCVSKLWYSLISNPHFCHRQSRIHCKKITGLFVLRIKMSSTNPEYDVVPLNETGEIPGDFIFNSVDGEPMEIFQSCNGLLCCQTGETLVGKHNYFICNPTTLQFRKLPSPIHGDFSKKNGIASVLAVHLAFDPRKSPHFKVLCMYFPQTGDDYLDMEIYSSETNQWTRQNVGDHLKMEVHSPEPGRRLQISNRFLTKFNFQKGVYWNGAINWLNFFMGDGLYFNVEEERIGKLPMLPLPNGFKQRRVMYFGESHDHLLLVEFYDPKATQFNVYEMNREYYSGWFIRYRIDIEVVMNSSLNPMWLDCYGFDIISVVLGGNDEDSFVVLGVPGKAIRYNLGDKSFQKIWDFSTSDDIFDIPPMFGWFDTFHCIESISNI